MQIAITSQNRRTITEHAGKCRKFWLYDIDADRIAGKRLVELPPEQSFHASQAGLPEALAGVQVLITAGMGGNLYRRLQNLGILALIACEEMPDRAVEDFLAGCLLTRSLSAAGHAHHPQTSTGQPH